MKATVTQLRQQKMAAEQMMALFPASQRAHATYTSKSSTKRADGKVEVVYRTVREPVTPELWERHFAGTYPLVLGLACDDGMCGVSAVDVDNYDVSLHELTNLIVTRCLPLYVRSSKSGGAHIYAFHDKLIPVTEALEVARGIGRCLGLGDKDTPGQIEFFPKPQSADPDRLVKGLNMPFLNGAMGIIRPGSKVAGQMLVDEFLRTVVHFTDEDRAALVVEATEQRLAPKDKGRRYAAARLKKYADYLAAAPLGRRNDTLTKHAFHMGTMIPRGWIEREAVDQTLRTSVAHWDDQPKTIDTLTRSLDDGEKKPHREMANDSAITEDSAALEFAERHADDLRFDHDAGSWFRWTGSHWARDNTSLAFSEARELVRELAAEESPRIRLISSKASFAGAVERFARADRGLVATQGAWDSDPFLLGTPGGTVELRTGTLRAARPEDGITKLTACAPADAAFCPTWQKFLSEATSGDTELIRFLQLVTGYAMTGDTREHLLVFVYGPGGNGKSVLLNTVGGLLGDYACAAAMETFTESHSDRHPTDLAMLRGARLVTCAETSEGRAWAETRIKQMTGGDPITARFMRRDFFTYQPAFQLLIVGNHQPRLHNITDAMRRRLAIVPFVHGPPTPDRELSEKLRAEWPGVLRWMIDGCLAWQAGGIVRPEVVLSATKEYFAEQDLFGQWIEQRLERAALAKESSTTLYDSWCRFAEKAGERSPGDMKWFTEQMTQRGFIKRKSHGARVYDGIRFRQAGAPNGNEDGNGNGDQL